MVTLPVEVFTDGSSIRNPGSSALAYIIRYYEDKEDGMPEAKEIEYSQGFVFSTNNRMEIMAVIYALKKVIDMINDSTFAEVRQVNLASDSEYFVKAINQNWINKWQNNGWMTSGFGNKKPAEVKNKDLWEQVVEILSILKTKNVNLIITHVQGHSGNEFNERCDTLAVTAANGSEFIHDEVYERTAPDYRR